MPPRLTLCWLSSTESKNPTVRFFAILAPLAALRETGCFISTAIRCEVCLLKANTQASLQHPIRPVRHRNQHGAFK
jgi:hypothetical protein